MFLLLKLNTIFPKTVFGPNWLCIRNLLLHNIGDNGKILELSRFRRKVIAQTKLAVLAVLQAGREGGLRGAIELV